MLSKPESQPVSTIDGRIVGPSVVFLAHPVQLASAFSLWADKGSNKDTYWRATWWMDTVLVSSVVFFISLIYYPISVLWLHHSPILMVDSSSHTFSPTYDSSRLQEDTNKVTKQTVMTNPNSNQLTCCT
jgi:hypothetical protein